MYDNRVEGYDPYVNKAPSLGTYRYVHANTQKRRDLFLLFSLPLPPFYFVVNLSTNT